MDDDEMMNEKWAATAADNVVPAEIARYNKRVHCTVVVLGNVFACRSWPRNQLLIIVNILSGYRITEPVGTTASSTTWTPPRPSATQTTYRPSRTASARCGRTSSAASRTPTCSSRCSRSSPMDDEDALVRTHCGIWSR
jgi:hypothetical protein